MRRDFILRTSESDTLEITSYGYENFESGNCIIHVHGFKGFKDWGFNPFLAQFFAKKGYFVITFNFSHNGIGKNPLEFTELEKFAENTFSLEVNELKEIINCYKSNFFGKIGKNKIGLLGHSRGGGISILNGNHKNVNCIAVWASVATFERYGSRQVEDWKNKGFVEVINTRTNQVMRMNRTLVEDLRNNKDNLDILKSVKNLDKPILIVHGKEDLAVPIKEAKMLFEAADKTKSELYIIDATGHTFNAAHPFDGSNPKLDLALTKTKEFFDINLN